MKIYGAFTSLLRNQNKEILQVNPYAIAEQLTYGLSSYFVTFTVLLPMESHPKKKFINQSATP